MTNSSAPPQPSRFETKTKRPNSLRATLGNVCFWLIILLYSNQQVFGQEKTDETKPKTPTIDSYAPQSMLRVASTPLTHAKFPVIDIHGHFGFRLKGDDDALAKYVETMDTHNISLSTSLDARLGSEEQHLEYLKKYSNRFLIFCHIDFIGKGDKDNPKSLACNQAGFVREVCQKLRTAKTKGIVGLKFFKQFGLGYKNPDGSLIAIDDRRFDPIWKTCGEIGFPVLMHTADPAAFFEPINDKNERYEELLRHPDWSFHGEQFPTRNQLLEARNRVIARHPQTFFIGAHMANNPEDLEKVSTWLKRYPNLYVEFSSRIAELGRQPFTARKFFLSNQDRILFGTDGPWPAERLTYYWRFLETNDEYFRYSEKTPQPQGLWFIYGLKLPDTALRKIYFENALKLVPSAGKQYQDQK